MRRRLFAVIAVAALGFAMPSHAETKTLDGDKTKKIEAKATAPQQTHDEQLATGLVGMAPDRSKCEAATCLRVPFKFAPVKGASGDVVFHITWANAFSDMDLSVVDAAGKTVVGCGASLGTGEIASVASDKLTKDATYTLIAYYYRTPGEEVAATIEFPGTYTPSDTTHEQFIDCGLDG